MESIMDTIKICNGKEIFKSDISYLATRTYDYNSSGQRCKQILTDGKHIEYAYDQYGQMTEAQKYSGTTPQADYQYSYETKMVNGCKANAG